MRNSVYFYYKANGLSDAGTSGAASLFLQLARPRKGATTHIACFRHCRDPYSC